MDDEKLYEKLSELSLGQQRIEDKLDNHLTIHKVQEQQNKARFDRITKAYIPAFGVVLPTISFLINWFHKH